ncbi:MAG: hypothetical protein HC933_16355 [Pleurocapsa sp. SU_196_0]|nr:hypothetical protein [Pleurocapsa sp. SU_196_0]
MGQKETMREFKVLHTSQEARNTTGDSNLKPLLEITTPDGLTLFYMNPLKILAKLFDGAGDEMPADTALFIFKSAPGKDFNTPVRKIPYANYYGATVVQQRNAEFEQNTVHDLGGVSGIENPEGHKFVVMYQSSATVDLTKAGTTFEVVPLASN